MMKAFEKLAKFYNKGWGELSSLYMKLVDYTIEKYNLSTDKALDVACGTGMLAADLSNKGFKVTGVDLSEDMIHEATRNNPELKFHVGDMRNFNINDKFNLITCAFDSINYLTDSSMMKEAIQNIYKHLSDGGIFIVDINTPALYEDKHHGTLHREFENIKFDQILEYDKMQRIGVTTFDFGEGQKEVHTQKAYTVEEMEGFLGEVGFNILEKFKDFKLSLVDERAYKVIFIARK
ncbi:class I SAM-dependent DNA methyltransferase [Oceanirhabdus sp. W0125-5]|uniref:class I SAM-dependent DNA methyltransferase n=1 Tax=Oceanirhabdus sp. W0125-5 TaxID=2999116 RepID=UPI0022F30378|nr:class I SAM-dependent methyltransferase [Oceanirhabdus sp. W0125-5]WBW94865.1 class I SAM-dependent methyltransferase [Oceanirhabdus sp. W0125-5]